MKQESYLRDELVEYQKENKRLKRSLQFHKDRVDELDRHKHKFTEPYLTMICNIIDNGKIKP